MAAEREQKVIYEQPLDERMRTFLRLELLFVQVRHHRASGMEADHRMVMDRLVDLLAVLGRGDVRSEVLKELERIGKSLEPFASREDVDAGRLRGILNRLQALCSQLAAAGGQFAQGLKNNEFLSAIRHRSSIPGGTCRFDLPAYHHWLTRPRERRDADLDRWFSELDALQEALALALSLVRESEVPRRQVARKGMFQQTMNSATRSRLIRVALDRDLPVFPEISGSKHRFTVRFLDGTDVAFSNARQTDRDVEFDLTLCRL